MGKKTVTTPGEKETKPAAKKAAPVSAAPVASAAAPVVKHSSKRVESGKVFINASYNNTVITVTDAAGNVLAWASAGSLGFSGPKKATPFASSKVIEALVEKIRATGPTEVHIVVKGIGSGRDSAIRSLINHGFNILSIKDATPVPFNGPRQPKSRRV